MRTSSTPALEALAVMPCTASLGACGWQRSAAKAFRRPLAHRPGERKDLREPEDVGDEQDHEDEQQEPEHAAGRKLVNLRGDRTGLLIGERGHARLDLGRIDA